MKTKKLMIFLVLTELCVSMFISNAVSPEIDMNREQGCNESFVSDYSQNDSFISPASISNENSDACTHISTLMNWDEKTLSASPRNIMLTGFWNPTGQMIAPYSTDPYLNPCGWKGGNWEGHGYDIYSYFPTPTTYNGTFAVDYQNVSQNFWDITSELHPMAIISFGAGGGPWEIEYNARNLALWVDDSNPPTQPTPSPPDSSKPVNYVRHSTLPVQAIADAVTNQSPINAWVDWNGNPGAYLCEYMAYHVMWYQDLHNGSSDPYQCLTAGFIHVDSGITLSDAMEATNITIQETIRYLEKNVNENINVSENNLKNTIQTLQDFDTRYVFSENCSLSAEWIYSKFCEYNLWTEYDYFEYENHTLKNVVGTLNGTSDNIYIISAHYDSINSKDEIKSTDDYNASAPGADDDASGVAGVLECARIMSNYRFNATIRFVAFSAEEEGLIGSSYYAEKMKSNDEKIICDIQLDMIGYGNDSIDIVANHESEWIAETMENVSFDYGIGLDVNKVVNPDFKYSDHASFWSKGYCGVCCIENATPWNSNPYFHSKNDTAEKLNFTLIRKTTQLCIAMLAVLANLSFPENVNKYALLIGIEDYPPGVKDLDYTIDDVYDMCDVLINNCYFDHENIRVLTDANATKENIQDNITWIASNAKQNDTVFFFFSGHGGHDYVLVYGNTISDNELDLWFSDINSTNLVIIIDSCYAGSMIEKSKSSYSDEVKNFSSMHGVKNEKTKKVDGFAKGLGQSGRIVLAACTENQYSWEYDELSNGVFTYYLIEGLKSASADNNSNGWISAEEAFYYAKPRVYEFNNSENPVGGQDPQIYDGIEGEIDLSSYGDLIIGTTEVYSNTNLTLNKNLTITSSGSLTLDNVILMMNCSFNGEYHIEVQSGGQLYIYNSNISSANEFCYLFWVRNDSKFEMRDSKLIKCGYEWGNIPNRGLIIETDNATIENCIISDNHIGICLKDSSDSIISNNTILKCMIGISCNNSSVKISGNTIISSVNLSEPWYATGIECISSTTTIINNTISGHYVGIELKDSTVNIINISIMNPNSGRGASEDISCYNSSLQIANSTLPLSPEPYNFRLEESSIINAINTTFNKTKVFMINSSLTVSWYLNINVLYQNDTTVKNANVVVCNIFMVEVFNGSTDENGIIKNIIVDEYIKNQTTTTYFTPYNITASKNGCCGSATVEMNQNREITIYLKDVASPNADAGDDKTVDGDTEIELDAGLSSDNIGIINYTWSFADQAKQITLYGSIVKYNFIQPGFYTVTLNVSDEAGNYDIDTVNITVKDVTKPVIENVSVSMISYLDCRVECIVYDNIGVYSVEISMDNHSWKKCVKEGNKYVGETGLEFGNNTVYVRVTDSSGNVNITSISVFVKVREAPVPDFIYDAIILVVILIFCMCLTIVLEHKPKRRKGL